MSMMFPQPSVYSYGDSHYCHGNSVSLGLLKGDQAGLLLNEQALQWLAQQPIIKSVAIMGEQPGSGSSFMLNCLANHHAFRVAQGTAVVTQGVDAFILPPEVGNSERHALFDVEAWGNKTTECHAKLLAAVLQVTSAFIVNIKGRPQLTAILEMLSALAIAAESLQTVKSKFGRVIIVIRDCADHSDGECQKVKTELFGISQSQDPAEVRCNEMRRRILAAYSGGTVVLLPPAHDSIKVMSGPTFSVRDVCEDFRDKIDTLRSLIRSAPTLCAPGTQQPISGALAASTLCAAVASINSGEGAFPHGILTSASCQAVSKAVDVCKRGLDKYIRAQAQKLANPDSYEVILRRNLRAEKDKAFCSISVFLSADYYQQERFIDTYIANLVAAEVKRNLQEVNRILEAFRSGMITSLEETATDLRKAIAENFSEVPSSKIQKDFDAAIAACLDDIRDVKIPGSGLYLSWAMVEKALKEMQDDGQALCRDVLHNRNEQELCVRRFRDYAAGIRSKDPKFATKPDENLEKLRDSHHDIHKGIEAVTGMITFIEKIRGAAEVIDIEATNQNFRAKVAEIHTRGSALVARAEDWELAISALAAGSQYLSLTVGEYANNSLNTLLAWCWNSCKDLECAEEVAIRLVQEAAEASKDHPTSASGGCGQGFAGRFKNALRGFIDVDYQTLDTDTSELFYIAWTHHVVNAEGLTLQQRRDKAIEIFEEFKVTANRRTDYLKHLEEHFAEES